MVATRTNINTLALRSRTRDSESKVGGRLPEGASEAPPKGGIEELSQRDDRSKLVEAQWPCWNFRVKLSERLTPLRIIGTQFRASLNHLGTIEPWCSWGFKEDLNRASMMPRGTSLSGSCTTDRCWKIPQSGTMTSSVRCAWHYVGWAGFTESGRGLRLIIEYCRALRCHMREKGRGLACVTAGKTTTSRLTSVRETGVSRHHEGLPETPRTPQYYSIEGFKGSS